MQKNDIYKISKVILEDFQKIIGKNYQPTLSEFLEIRQEAIKEYNNVDFEPDTQKCSFNVTDTNNMSSQDSYPKESFPQQNLFQNNQHNVPPKNVQQNNINNQHQPTDFEILKSIKDPWNN